MAKIHELKLHEEIDVTKAIWVSRVPGGWIYHSTAIRGTSVFVPFSCEFSSSQAKKEGDNQA